MQKSKGEMLPPAVYVNLFQVAPRQSEFFFSFGQMAREKGTAAHLLSCVVTTPIHAKSMLTALQDAVERYEERFGEIPAVPAADPDADSGKRAGSAPPHVKRAMSRGTKGDAGESGG